MTRGRSPDVAMVTPSLAGGGAERVAVELAGAFAGRNLAVDMVMATGQGPYLEQLSPAVRQVDLGKSRMRSALIPLIRYIRRARPGVIIAFQDHCNIFCLLAKRLAGSRARMIVTVHDVFSLANRQSKHTRARLMIPAARLLYPWADEIVAVSPGGARDLERELRLPAGKVRVLPNPVVTPRLFAMAEEQPEHPFALDGAPPFLLAVSRLEKVKGYSTILRAFARIAPRTPARLLILGEGEDRPRLEALVRELGLADRVAMPGFLKNPYACMARAAVFVLGSRREAFGNVLVEAMALGRPIVSTACVDGPVEILENGRWGWLTPIDDDEAMAQAMLEALERGVPDIEALRRRAADFSLERIAGDYLELAGFGDERQTGSV